MRIRNLGIAAGLVFAGASVAAADSLPLELFTVGASGVRNGALFQETSTQPAGSGFIDPFIRIQAANGNQKYEAGFNTNDPSKPLDDKDAGNTNFNHAIQIKDLATVTINGTDYVQFALDFNEPVAGQKSLLSLQDFQLFVSDSATNSSLATLGAKVFDLDVGPDGNSRVDGQADLAPGSGKFNMIANVPKSVFDNLSTNKYVYLYTYFGEQGSGSDKGYASNGGFEEWVYNSANSSPPVPGEGVPLPAAASGGLLLLVGLGIRRGRRSRTSNA